MCLVKIIKNKIYKQMDMGAGFCGRMFLNEAINDAYELGKHDAIHANTEGGGK